MASSCDDNLKCRKPYTAYPHHLSASVIEWGGKPQCPQSTGQHVYGAITQKDEKGLCLAQQRSWLPPLVFNGGCLPLYRPG